MALPTASDNPFPSLLITEGTEPAAPAAGKQRVYIDSTTHHLKRTDSSGTDVDIESAAANGLATDTLWDAAGDLAVGTGANTAAKLTKGSAGATLAMSNGAVVWNAGTSFPGSPATNDRYWRTDRGLEYYYDGTRWLCTCLHIDPMSLSNSAVVAGITDTGATVTHGRWTVPYADTYDIYIVDLQATTFVGATNNGTNFWTLAWNWGNAAGTFTLVDSFTTAGDTQATYVFHREAVGAVLNNTAVSMVLSTVDTLSPGTLIISGSAVSYRFVG